MRLEKKLIFRTVIIKAIIIVVCTAILPPNAIGQQVPEQSVHIGTSEIDDPNTKSLGKKNQEELFSVSIDDAEIKDVLDSLACQAGLSLVLPEDVKGRISLRLKGVTWQTALNAVLHAGGYTATEKDNVLYVSDSKKTLVTETFNLNFANAKDIEKTISKLVSREGKVGIYNRLNSIVVSDTAANLEQIRQALRRLDSKAPQVMIEVLIVNVKLTDELKMGVDWTKLGTSSNFFSQGLSITGSSNPFGKVTFLKTPGDWSIQGLIDFVETNKNVRILANPKVLVLNNHTATIDSVEEIPYQELSETSAGGSIGTTSFKEAGVKLEVTPQITDDGYIIMNVKPEQSARIDTITVQNSQIPVIETRKTDTTLRVRDGQTIIIGGLRKIEPSVQENKVPILGDAPLIGVLFRKVVTTLIESELGVFITPHIYTDGKLSAEESKLIEKGQKSQSLYEASDLLRLQPNDKKNR